MTALNSIPGWAWWLIDSAFVLAIVVMVLWGRRIMKHPIAYSSATTAVVGARLTPFLRKCRGEERSEAFRGGDSSETLRSRHLNPQMAERL